MKLTHSHSSTLKIINNRGFTLVELMIAVAIAAIVMGALGTAYVSQRRTATAQEQVDEMQQSIRAALDIMTHEIRMAGYDPRHTAGAGFPESPPGPLVATSATNLTFSMLADTDGIDNNGAGGTDEANEIAMINYHLTLPGYLNPTAATSYTSLGRRTPVNTMPVADNIDAIEFYYTMADGTQTLAPAPLSNIRAVTISILARASRPDPDYTYNLRDSVTNNLIPYEPASCPNVPASCNGGWDINFTGNPPFTNGTNNPPGANDHFRRRLFITTVQCRNMGL